MVRNDTVLASLNQLTNWGYFTTDTDLQITSWSGWLEANSGRSAVELLNRNLFEAFPEFVTRRLNVFYEEALQGKVIVLAQQLHKFLIPMPPSILGTNLSHAQQSVRLAPLFEDGKIVGTLTVIEDVTERVVAEADLAAQAEELVSANRRKDEFLAMLAHELRNPLAPIRNSLQLVRLLSEDARPEVRHAYDIIDRQVENMVRLVDDLLDVSRITTGKVKLQKERVDLASVIARAVEGARPLIDARRHHLELKLPEQTAWIDGDPLRLAQVLWNLLNNAAKYTPEGGTITLTVKRHEKAEVRVRDTGMGISAEMLPRIFDLFTQMERTLDRADGGLGVGLTLVRRLTELHGGTIQVFSKGPGQGSEFLLQLPLSEAPVRQVEQSEQVENAPPAGLRILVVDDNRDSAESLSMLLRLFGNEVQTLHEGGLVLDCAAGYHPDVVLLDIGLPGLDGLEVCRRLRAHSFDFQPLIIAMTGYGQEEDRARSEQAGFDAHLVKPVDLAALQDVMSRHQLAQD